MLEADDFVLAFLFMCLFLGCSDKVTPPEKQDNWVVYKQNIPFKSITKLFAHDGDIWVPGENNYSIYLLRNDSWNEYNLGNSFFPHNMAFEGDTVWLVGSNGLGKLDAGGFVLMDYPDMVYFTKELRHICVDRGAVKWLAGGYDASTYTGLLRLDGSQFNWWSMGNVSKQITCLSAANDGALFISTGTGGDSGIALLKLKDSVFQRIEMDTKNNIIDLVTCLAQDLSGNLWVGTNNGLFKYDNVQWSCFNKNNIPVQDNYIRNIAVDKNNKLWVVAIDWPYNTNSQDSKLICFDGTKWETIEVAGTDIVWVAVDDNNNKWVAKNMLCGTESFGCSDYARVGCYNEDGIK